MSDGGGVLQLTSPASSGPTISLRSSKEFSLIGNDDGCKIRWISFS